MNVVYFRQKTVILEKESKKEGIFVQKPNKFFWIGLFLMLLCVAIYKISEERERKLAQSLAKIEREHQQPVCEQYVLLARKDDYYPCLSCKDRHTIFLRIGEVWRYGVTGEKGELGRYPNHVYYNKKGIKLNEEYLIYRTQFKGTRQECLKEELRKIIKYPELPECLVRNFFLERPAGNPQDR